VKARRIGNADDVSVADGLLNNEAIATTIIGLLRAKPDHPVTIGVHGDWGAGKSSVLEMIEAGFADQDDVLCLKFNGWRFQGFEDAKIALIEGIVTGLVEKRPALKKAAVAVKDVFRRIDWLKVAKRAERFNGGVGQASIKVVDQDNELFDACIFQELVECLAEGLHFLRHILGLARFQDGLRFINGCRKVFFREELGGVCHECFE